MSTPENSAASRGIPFGRYVIRRRLGRGGMGEVFLAEQLGPLGPVRPVALKRMLPQLAQDAQVSRMFLEEMALAAQLNHPGIATTYDFGDVGGVYFIAMEYVEGLPLSTILEKLGPLPLAETLTIVRALSDALGFAHEEKRPVVHCDVSPQNVLISLRGAVKLLDFGIAAAEAALLDRARGKRSYAAPEQLLGHPPDRRFDIWSLGVLTYQLLAGKLPAGAETGNYLELANIRPELATVSGVIGKALALSADDRFSSTRAFSEALTRAARVSAAPAEKLSALVERSGGTKAIAEVTEMTATGMPLAVEESAETVRVEEKKRRPWISISAAIAALALVALFRWMPKPAEEPETRALPVEEPPPKIAIAPPQPALEAQPITEETPADKPEPRPKSSPKKTKKEPVRRAPEAEASGHVGVLAVRATPWAKIFLDERILGEGVVAPKPVPAGKHTLRLVPGDERYAPQTIEIEIRAGEQTRVRVDFETGSVIVDPS